MRARIMILVTALLGCAAEADVSVEALELRVTLTNQSTPGLLDGVDVGFSPGVWVLHEQPDALLTVGESASHELERLAEDGDSAPLLEVAQQQEAVVRSGTFGGNEAGVSYGGAPILPGSSVDFVLTAMSDEYLSLVSMFGQTNDIVVALHNHALGDLEGVTLVLLDVGTEVNELPGAGENQPAAQKGPGAGLVEDQVVGPPDDAFEYPAVADIVTVAIERR